MSMLHRRLPVALSLLITASLALGCGGDGTGPSNNGGNNGGNGGNGGGGGGAPDTVPLRVLASARGRFVGGATGQLLTMAPPAGDSLRKIAGRQFSMVWSGVFLKFSTLRPTRATYNYTNADSMVAFAQRNAMVVRGHTLAWHNQLPAWLTGGTWSKDTALAILKDHIANVVGHYKGKLAAWDVVNEAVNDGSGTLRSGFWLDHIGPEYIDSAFIWTRRVDPDVPLFYNDYNIETRNTKSDSVFALLSRLKAAGVPINGIGFQGHFKLPNVPTRQALVDNLNRFAALGLKIQFTEVEFSIKGNGGPPSTQSLLQQAAAYRDLMEACLLVSTCDAVELAGFYDGNWGPPDGDASYGAALLFDSTMTRKPAFDSMRAVIKRY